jgi:hypothetical protein
MVAASSIADSRVVITPARASPLAPIAEVMVNIGGSITGTEATSTTSAKVRVPLHGVCRITAAVTMIAISATSRASRNWAIDTARRCSRLGARASCTSWAVLPCSVRPPVAITVPESPPGPLVSPHTLLRRARLPPAGIRR